MIFSYRASIVFLTYVAYMSYHLSRKPISVVKTVLHQNCSGMTPPPDIDPSNRGTWCDWAPFSKNESHFSKQCSLLYTFRWNGLKCISTAGRIGFVFLVQLRSCYVYFGVHRRAIQPEILFELGDVVVGDFQLHVWNRKEL